MWLDEAVIKGTGVAGRMLSAAVVLFEWAQISLPLVGTAVTRKAHDHL